MTCTRRMTFLVRSIQNPGGGGRLAGRLSCNCMGKPALRPMHKLWFLLREQRALCFLNVSWEKVVVVGQSLLWLSEGEDVGGMRVSSTFCTSIFLPLRLFSMKLSKSEVLAAREAKSRVCTYAFNSEVSGVWDARLRLPSGYEIWGLFSKINRITIMPNVHVPLF